MFFNIFMIPIMCLELSDFFTGFLFLGFRTPLLLVCSAFLIGWHRNYLYVALPLLYYSHISNSSPDELHSMSRLLRNKSRIGSCHDDDDGFDTAASSFIKCTNETVLSSSLLQLSSINASYGSVISLLTSKMLDYYLAGCFRPYPCLNRHYHPWL